MARMLVEPRRIRDGNLVGCTGVTMEDGRVFMANKRGHIDGIDDRTAREMVKNPLAPGHVIEQKFSAPSARAATCSGCSFNGFAWQRQCPKCSGEMVKEESE